MRVQLKFHIMLRCFELSNMCSRCFRSCVNYPYEKKMQLNIKYYILNMKFLTILQKIAVIRKRVFLQRNNIL